MTADKSKLTVLFEEPFWIGLYERESKGRYQVCRIVFGAEPKEYEVYAFLLENWSKLRFSPSLESCAEAEKRINPKRMRRILRREMKASRPGTKAQQALNLQREQGKAQRLQQVRSRQEEQRERQFELRREKHKKKHRGR